MKRWRLWIALLIGIGLFWAAHHFSLASRIANLEGAIGELGSWGQLLYAFLYIAATLFLVPGSLITLSAGVLFGLGKGLVTVSLASTTAAALAFLLARTLLRKQVEDWARTHPRFSNIDRAVGEGGWRVIALLRLSPAIPFSISNYLFGLTKIAFVPYVLASWLAMLPGTLLYVYLGYVGRAGAEATLYSMHAGNTERTAWEWAFLAVGLVATVVVTVYITRLAKKAQAQGASA